MKLPKLFRRKPTLSTYRSMWGSGNFISIADYVQSVPEKEKKADERTVAKPIEVWEQLVAEKPNLDCTDLEKKIKVVKERIHMIEQFMRDVPNDEYEVLGYLEARRKYIQFQHLFQWPITTNEMVSLLCKQYKLKTARFEEFYTLIPREGIDELKSFKDACVKIRKENPVIRLIVPDDPEREKEMRQRKRDPILLASSPFGRWEYILGAWDKEVAIVDDFIYKVQ